MVGGGSAAEEPVAAMSVAAPDELRLLRRIGKGDLRAFEQLYRAYYPRLARFLANLVRRPELVEELVNDTLLAVWSRPDGYAGSSRLSTWMFAIAYRKAMRARRRWDEPVEDKYAELREAPDAGPEQELGRRQARQALLQAMARLSPDHRAVVDLSYFQELGYREIAEIMGCPVDTVKTRMFHARRSLKTALAGSLVDWL